MPIWLEVATATSGVEVGCPGGGVARFTAASGVGVRGRRARSRGPPAGVVAVACGGLACSVVVIACDGGRCSALASGSRPVAVIGGRRVAARAGHRCAVGAGVEVDVVA